MKGVLAGAFLGTAWSVLQGQGQVLKLHLIAALVGVAAGEIYRRMSPETGVTAFICAVLGGLQLLTLVKPRQAAGAVLAALLFGVGVPQAVEMACGALPLAAGALLVAEVFHEYGFQSSWAFTMLGLGVYHLLQG